MVTSEQYLEERVRELSVADKHRRRETAVITAYNGITPLGQNWDSFNNMLAGNSGIRDLNVVNYHTNIAAPVDFDPKQYMDRRDLRGLAQVCAMARYFAREAEYAAGLIESPESEKFKKIRGLDMDRVAEWVASGEGPTANVILIYRQLLKGTEDIADPKELEEKIRKNSERILPLQLIEMLAEEVGANISYDKGLKGWSGGSYEACATGLSNVVEGARIIMDGRADVVIAGGFEDILSDPGNIYLPHISIGGFVGMKNNVLSAGKKGPEKSSRPFDAERDGFVLGAGGAAFVLERKSFALARGAKPIAEIVGFNKAMSGHRTDLMPDVLARAIARTLRHPVTKKLQIPDVIFTHSTATAQDRMEAKAHHLVLGELMKEIPITAIKSWIGHAAGGAGSQALMTALQSMETGRVPYIANLDNPRLNVDDLNVSDDGIIKDMHFVREKPLDMGIDTILVNAYAFGGFIASMLIKKF